MTVYGPVPGQRIAYDIDGSAVLTWTGNTVADLFDLTVWYSDVNYAKKLNSNRQLVGFNNNAWVVIVFPGLRDLVGFFIGQPNDAESMNVISVQISTDTTNGIDGTWTTIAGSYDVSSISSPWLHQSRTEIIEPDSPGDWDGVRGFRMHCDDGSQRCLHLYGSPSAGQELDRLRLWKPVTDAEVDPDEFDLGEIMRNESGTFSFRVKNNSSTLDADDVTVALDANSDHPSIGLLDEFDIRYDGGAWGDTANVGPLASGAISAVCDVRYTISPTSKTFLQTLRINATTTGWT